MPPSTTMARMIADSMKVNDSGVTRPWRAAKKLPAKPAKQAPRVNAESLITVGFRPSARQAISSSRRASQARPIGMRSRRLITNNASRASSRATRYRKMTLLIELYCSPKNSWKVCMPSAARRSKVRPKNSGLGMLLMPLGPPVQSVRLRRNRRMISPKPRVTIAR
ncbi:hypothetical protein D9M71_677650 [compost metagenome]